MILNVEGVTIYSGNAEKLAEFYKEKVGMKPTMEAEMGEGTNVIVFEMKGGSSFSIIDHSEVHGKNKDSKRYMVNFEVSDIEKTVKKLKKAGVKKIADIYHIQEYGYVATFEDLDGNYFQLVKTKE